MIWKDAIIQIEQWKQNPPVSDDSLYPKPHTLNIALAIVEVLKKEAPPTFVTTFDDSVIFERKDGDYFISLEIEADNSIDIDKFCFGKLYYQDSKEYRWSPNWRDWLISGWRSGS